MDRLQLETSVFRAFAIILGAILVFAVVTYVLAVLGVSPLASQVAHVALYLFIAFSLALLALAIAGPLRK